MKTGDKVYVLLPYWAQIMDGVGPYVEATVLSVGSRGETVKIEYDTPKNGIQDLMIDEHLIQKIS